MATLKEDSSIREMIFELNGQTNIHLRVEANLLVCWCLTAGIPYMAEGITSVVSSSTSCCRAWISFSLSLSLSSSRCRNLTQVKETKQKKHRKRNFSKLPVRNKTLSYRKITTTFLRLIIFLSAHILKCFISFVPQQFPNIYIFIY